MPSPIGLLPSCLENNKRIKRTLQASAPFLQQHLIHSSFSLLSRKKPCLQSLLHDTKRDGLLGSGLGVKVGTAIFPGTHRPAFPSRRKLMKSFFFFLKKVFQTYYILFLNLRVESGLRGHLARHLSPCRKFPLSPGPPCWGSSPLFMGPPMMGACHLKVQCRPFI